MRTLHKHLFNNRTMKDMITGLIEMLHLKFHFQCKNFLLLACFAPKIHNDDGGEEFSSDDVMEHLTRAFWRRHRSGRKIERSRRSGGKAISGGECKSYSEADRRLQVCDRSASAETNRELQRKK